MPMTSAERQARYRVIIAGSRDFNDKQLLDSNLDMLIGHFPAQETVILCGMARGADTLGMQWAQERGYAVVFYPAQWKVFGKRAGYLRNAEMAKDATHLVAFWDGESKGTQHMINLAKEYNLHTHVVYTASEYLAIVSTRPK